jgi:hypothetical protein
MTKAAATIIDACTDEALFAAIPGRAPKPWICRIADENDDPIECRDYVREKAGLPTFIPG